MKNATKSHSRSQDRNAFVKGSTNFQRSALLRHKKSDDHRLALTANQRKDEMTAAVSKVFEVNSRALYCQVGAAMILAQDDL